MRKQHRWIRQQLICCFIHTYTQVHHLPPTVREIGAWVGCPGMRSLQRALADLQPIRITLRSETQSGHTQNAETPGSSLASCPSE